MHRSSESTAAIATALAKAQTELSNPEKAMVGTIYTNRSDSPQPFRYASLSAGLDIIRKTLGGQQIAIAQTTDIDRANGMVNLTTVLLHTSGEWISSHWPVCPLSETSVPRRMGAALTYARRYALFTMVGIAGEDDLDAPDLSRDQPNGDKPSTASLSNTVPASGRPTQVRTGSPAAAPIREKLGIEESAAIRAQLIDEIETIQSPAEAQSRAIAILKAKNGLAPADAKLVEAAYSARMALLADPPEPVTAVESKPAPIDATPPPQVVVKRGRGRPRKTKSPPQMPVELPVEQ
ncbi:MAG: ERF family protein, partial [Isosphaeraceae bacterium]